MFSPTQFGLDLLLPANFVASRSPSLKAADVRVKAACALAACEPHRPASATVTARMEPRKSMLFPLNIVGDTGVKRAECSVQRMQIKAISPGGGRRLS